MTAMRIAAGALIALAAAALALAAAVPGALAHEVREQDGFMLDIGFLNEPAYEQLPNGVELTVTQTGGSGEAFEADLMVEVSHEAIEQSDVLPLEALYNRDGEGGFRAVFVPTTPGDYTFRVFGTLGGQEIDEAFTSGPDTFDHVQALRSFPPQLSAREVQNTATNNQEELTELRESLRNLRVGLWATVAALGILIVSTGIATLAFLRVARQQREGR